MSNILRFGFVYLSLCLCASPVGASAREDLHTLIEQEWKFRLQADPLFATRAGYYEYNDLLPQITLEAFKQQNDFRQTLLVQLQEIKFDKLNPLERVNYAMFKRELEDEIAEYTFNSYLIPINADSGFHISFAHLWRDVPLNNALDYKNYIARLYAFKTYMDQHIALMRVGLQRGITLPQVILEGYESTIASHALDNVEQSVFYRRFESFPVGVSPEDYAALRKAGAEAIASSIIPAYRTFLDFILNEYKPQARKSIAAVELPYGEAFYAHRVKMFTTLNVTPEDVHRVGLQEVQRIRAEMEALIEEIGFKGSFSEFLKFLRSDKQFYAESPRQLLKEARDIAKRMDAKLPAFFKTLPRTPYGVEAVPDDIAPKYTTGRYVGTTLGSTEPGYYWVNTYALEKRPLYTLPALTLHEAVPGHHLQFSLAQENADIPNFRRFKYVTAFSEGWGLYSEKLGVEAGIYTTPYEHFGRLTYEMWRASRLVVDTGMHAMGWTRQQAMDYMAANSALSLHNIRTETDRYIAWPGQALAYKMGELKIWALRKRAEQALQEKFDIRTFHDAVLKNGGVPLSVLEEQVEAYINSALP